MKFLKSLTRDFLANRPLFYALIRPIESALIKAELEQLHSPILDFGCGDGFFTKTVFGKRQVEVGIDVFESRASEAHRQNIYQQIVLYDGNKIPFEANYFSTVIANSVLEHIPNLNQNLKEIQRVLKSEGCFVTTVMTNKWEKYLLGAKVLGKRYQYFMREQQEHFNLLSAQDWQDRFEQAGFKTVKMIGYLTECSAAWIELLHYLSLPSLWSHRLFQRWVIWQDWYRFFNLDELIFRTNQKAMTNIEDAAALFFVLQK